ncbi:hypothetical protein AVEN_228077-1 [Araneus ventricosus]|uniref:Uncharacterized protein n=1 Tax=Araneus ventricosus TaxID=182803 RepID=A0A4Y2F8R2_ARAVE|nr:hypothetical protein AVEN_228077-1 [Araneus ventricosus]
MRAHIRHSLLIVVQELEVYSTITLESKLKELNLGLEQEKERINSGVRKVLDSTVHLSVYHRKSYAVFVSMSAMPLPKPLHVTHRTTGQAGFPVIVRGELHTSSHTRLV